MEGMTADTRLSHAQEAALPPVDLIVGVSPVMEGVRACIEHLAVADVPVLIQGESGCGKEVLTRWIHACSPRAARPFVKLHCPAIPETLLESELFGHEEGAFTGAVRAKPGRVEEAEGGTLFLDEIAEMNSGLQAKLLHLLQDGQISRLGGCEQRAIDVRIICATNRKLEDEIQAGRFRSDLFYRINVVSLELPPLRERKADLPMLAEYFVQVYARRYRRSVPPLSAATLRLLQAHTWPGNIRELENLINRYVIFGSESIIASDILGKFGEPARQAEPPSISLRKIARQAALEAQRQVILQVLHANQWNRKQAARALNISYRALLYKLRDTGIPTRRAMQLRQGPTASPVN